LTSKHRVDQDRELDRMKSAQRSAEKTLESREKAHRDRVRTLETQINSLRDQIELEMKRKAFTASQSDLANMSGSMQNLSYSGLGGHHSHHHLDKSAASGEPGDKYGAAAHSTGAGLDYTPTRLTPRARSPFKRSSRASPLPSSVARLRAGSLPRSRTDISKLH